MALGRKVLPAVVAIATLVFVTSAPAVEKVCGDVNQSGAVNTSDALAVLKNAVGQPVSLACPDFSRRIGHPNDTNLNSLFDLDYLIAFPITVEFSVTVTHFGMISRDSGTHVKMALYTDSGGTPGSLVVGSTSHQVSVGTQEIPVTATPIAPGTYWIASVYDQPTTIATDENAPPGNLVRYRTLPFGNSFPSTFNATDDYDETIINYWIKVIE